MMSIVILDGTSSVIFARGSFFDRLIHKWCMRRSDREKRKLKMAQLKKKRKWTEQFMANLNFWYEDSLRAEAEGKKKQNIICKDPRYEAVWNDEI